LIDQHIRELQTFENSAVFGPPCMFLAFVASHSIQLFVASFFVFKTK